MDIVSNKTGEYLKFHVEVETEGSTPYHQLPEYKRFRRHWQVVADKLAESGISPTEHDRNVAENWFLWGFMEGRLTP